MKGPLEMISLKIIFSTDQSATNISNLFRYTTNVKIIIDYCSEVVFFIIIYSFGKEDFPFFEMGVSCHFQEASQYSVSMDHTEEKKSMSIQSRGNNNKWYTARRKKQKKI
jgi:hypothetical protein